MTEEIVIQKTIEAELVKATTDEHLAYLQGWLNCSDLIFGMVKDIARIMAKEHTAFNTKQNVLAQRILTDLCTNLGTTRVALVERVTKAIEEEEKNTATVN